ncbi:hypothetical protein AB0399_10055 [Streptomyces sp. NPDC088194]|uniref:hypothetical protein n=1 Tax=Streptomyces sp. NPDC088194 TaxID=3154931 RepID=UPI00344CFA59
MVVRIEGQSIQGTRLIGSRRTYAGVELVGSTLTSCVLAQFDDPDFGLVVRDALIQGCTVDRCQVQGVYFEDLTVDGLNAKQIHRMYGCVFNRVVLKGKVGPVMVMPPHGGLADRERHMAGLVERYRGVEWALDISEASFVDADFYCVPGDLVKYDPETQILLRREKFKGVEIESLPTYAGIWVSRFSETPFDSLVAVAPKRSKSFSKYMHDIEWLHAQGYAG